MDRQDELSATDKLLQVIKGKGEISDHHPGTAAAPAVKKTSSKFKMFPLLSGKEKKSVNIGIDIGKTHLRLVKANRTASRDWKILDMASFPYPGGVKAGDAEYSKFVEQRIKAFCDPEDCNLWVISYSENLEIRHIRIPKVAKKDLFNAVYWTFKKEFPYNESEFTMDYEVQDEVFSGGSTKISVMAYITPKSEIEEMKKFFSEMGLNIAGMTIRPFAVHNLIRSSQAIISETLAFLYIGDESSRIDIYASGNLTMTRAIKAGTRSMVDALYEGLRETRPDFTYEDAETILNMRLDAAKGHRASDLSGVSPEEIFAFLSPALDRIVRQAERTFDYYATLYAQTSVQKVFISSDVKAHKTLATYIGNQLGVSCKIFDPLEESPLEKTEPLSGFDLAERIAFISALGAACSDQSITPNLLFGYVDKETEASIKKINRGVLSGFAAILILCLAVFACQNMSYAQKKEEGRKLESQLATFKTVIDRNALADLAGQIKENHSIHRSLAARYQAMAVLSEVSAVTPREIRLISLDFDASETANQDETEQAADQSGTKQALMIEGIIEGERGNFESLLTGYTFKLDSSPFFEGVTIQKSSYVPFAGRDVLHFVVNAKVS